MKLTSYRDQLFPFFYGELCCHSNGALLSFELVMSISLWSQWKLFKYQKVWNKKKTIVIVLLQHKCVFSTQIRQNAFRICVYVLNSTRQNIYFVLNHAHMAQLACMRAFSVRNQFILFVQSCSSTSMSWIFTS